MVLLAAPTLVLVSLFGLVILSALAIALFLGAFQKTINDKDDFSVEDHNKAGSDPQE